MTRIPHPHLAARLPAAGRLLALASCLLVACGQNYSDKPAAEALRDQGLTAVGAAGAGHGEPAPAAAPAEGHDSFGEVTAAVPADWRKVPPSSSMRVAEYAIAPSRGGAQASELAVFAGTWGSVDDNVTRWFGQFAQPDGRSTAAVGRRWELDSDGGLRVAMVDVSGTYTSGGMGTGSGVVSPRPGYRMLGAIVDAKSRFYYLKLTGPAVEIDALEDGFERLVRSLRKS